MGKISSFFLGLLAGLLTGVLLAVIIAICSMRWTARQGTAFRPVSVLRYHA